VTGVNLVKKRPSNYLKLIFRYVLDQLFSNQSREEMLENIHQYLQKVGDDVRKDDVPLSKYVITKVIFFCLKKRA
jgi:DNA polymerase alpha subunit A